MIRVIGTGSEGRADNQFNQPRGICVDNRTKEVFIVDCNNHRIQVFNLRSLAYIRSIGRGHAGQADGFLNYAVGVCMDNTQQLFVADTNNHRVAVFNQSTGQLVRNIGRHGVAPGLLNSPYGVCLDAETDALFVADYDNHRVQVFCKETGNFRRSLGLGHGSGPGYMNQPIVVAIDGDTGRLFVADYSNNRVQVLDKTGGEFLGQIGSGLGDDLHGPRGLCLDRGSGLLFVSDRENHRVGLYQKDTLVLLRYLGSPGSELGQFNRPMELCVSVDDGALLVVDGYNHRVQVMEVPELQEERGKAQQAARARAEAEERERRRPKASRVAAETRMEDGVVLCAETLPWVRARSTRAASSSFPSSSSSASASAYKTLAVVRFPHLGPLFDLRLEWGYLSRLYPRGTGAGADDEGEGAAEGAGWGGAQDITPRRLGGGLMVSTSRADSPGIGSGLHAGWASPAEAECATDDIISRQAQTFLSIIVELHQQRSPLSYTIPATLALHSLLERAWRPDRVSAEVVASLTRVLCDLRGGTVSAGEKDQVVAAVSSILLQSARVGPEAAEMVYASVLDGLRWLGGDRSSACLSADGALSPPPTPNPTPTPTSALSVTTSAAKRPHGPGQAPGDTAEATRALLCLVASLLQLQEDEGGAGLWTDFSGSTGATWGSGRCGGQGGAAEAGEDIQRLVFGEGFLAAGPGLQGGGGGADEGPGWADVAPSSARSDTPSSEALTPLSPSAPAPAAAAAPAPAQASASSSAQAYSRTPDSLATLPPPLCRLLECLYRLRRLRGRTGCGGGGVRMGGRMGGGGGMGGSGASSLLPDARLQLLHAAEECFRPSSHGGPRDGSGCASSARAGHAYAHASLAQAPRRTRGARNIWRPEEPMQVPPLCHSVFLPCLPSHTHA